MYLPVSVKKSLLALTAAITVGTAAVPLSSVQAIDFGTIGTLISAGAEYAYLNKQLNYLNNEGRDEFMEEVKKQYGVNHDPAANAMVARIMSNLSASVAAIDPSIREKPYKYFVNNDTSFNAFCTLGHNMSVNIGLFQPLNYNENEVAFVLAHEMGHGQKDHPIQGFKKSIPFDLLSALYGANSSAAQLGTAIVSQIGTANLVTKPMEKQADALAFTYATGAGYNPGAGAALWQRMLDQSGNIKTSGVMELFNDHPNNVSRRDTYSKTLTKWSNNVVKVDADTGMISLHGKDWYQPEDMTSMSGKERAYLIAGNLSAVYHQTKKPTAQVYVNGNQILCVGNQPIMDLRPAQDPQKVTADLKALL
ncbi:M48 family metallopeptidase [uncultured Megasphaera sp.]|uniref:M48 family metallopeptidase n=1 Tax=uncultured Megasphaera sp. TaxID=165188 RepID=UPI0026582B73|nr:M48 family metallopeptidase [uncultured Megasphaera sp.]